MAWRRDARSRRRGGRRSVLGHAGLERADGLSMPRRKACPAPGSGRSLRAAAASAARPARPTRRWRLGRAKSAPVRLPSTSLVSVLSAFVPGRNAQLPACRTQSFFLVQSRRLDGVGHNELLVAGDHQRADTVGRRGVDVRTMAGRGSTQSCSPCAARARSSLLLHEGANLHQSIFLQSHRSSLLSVLHAVVIGRPAQVLGQRLVPAPPPWQGSWRRDARSHSRRCR